MGGECIAICMDTSIWMGHKGSLRFQKQAEAIQLYCKIKIESHQETFVAIVGMANKCLWPLCLPTRDLSLIKESIYSADIGGNLLLTLATYMADSAWIFCRPVRGEYLPRRIVMFAGGPVYAQMGIAPLLGKAMREKKVACDVICFGHPAKNKKQLFKTLVEAADNDGNSNLLHIPTEFSNSDALMSSPIIQSASAPFPSLPVQPESSEENINRSQIIQSGSKPFASLHVQPKSSKQNTNNTNRPPITRTGSTPFASSPVQSSKQKNTNRPPITRTGSASFASGPVQISKQKTNRPPITRTGSTPFASSPVQSSKQKNTNRPPITRTGSTPFASSPVQSSKQKNTNRPPITRTGSASFASGPVQISKQKTNRPPITRTGSTPFASSPVQSSKQKNTNRPPITRTGSTPFASSPVQSSKQKNTNRPPITRTGSTPFASSPVQSSKQKNTNRPPITRTGSTPFASSPVQSSKQKNTNRPPITRTGSAPFASGPVQSSRQKTNRYHVGVKENPGPGKKAADANYPESVDPHHQSVVDLKLESVKPNSQPETLSQRIERARLELRSLIMQKEKHEKNQKEEAK